MAKLVVSRRNPPEEPSRSLVSSSSSKPTNFSLPRPQTQQTTRSRTMTMVSSSGSPQSRPTTSAAQSSISRTAYAPLQVKPYRIRPSSAAGLLNERPSTEHIPITPIKGQKRPIKIVPVAPAPVPVEDRPDYGWEHPPPPDGHRSTSGLGHGPEKTKPDSEKKRWSAGGALSKWLKWTKPLSTSKATAAHVEAYLKQQRDYEAQRLAEENQPPIQLPDTAVAGTTIAGHRYIAISIPYGADPFSRTKQQQQPPPRPRRGPVARLHAPPRPPSRPMTAQASPEVLNAVSRPVYSPASMDSQPFLPPIICKPTIAAAAAAAATATPSPAKSTESDASHESGSGSDSSSNSYADSVTTAATSVRTETPQPQLQLQPAKPPPQRPAIVPRRSTSILTQLTQQAAAASKDVTITSHHAGAVSTTTVQRPRRRTATVSGNIRGGGSSGAESIDGVMLARSPITPLSPLMIFPQPISPQALSQPSAYPSPLGPIPDIPPIAAQKAKLAELQAARKAAEREEAERAAASAKAAKRRSLPMRTRQQEKAAKLAPISITAEPLTRRDSKLAAPMPSPVPESPMDPMAFAEQRRSRQERVRERKMRDIQRARSSRERGSISSIDTPLGSPLLMPAAGGGSSSPKMSTVMLIAEVVPAETPGGKGASSSSSSSRYASARERLSRRRRGGSSSRARGVSASDADSRPGSAGGSVADSLAGFEASSEQMRDMERRLRRLERSTGDAVVKALGPALANLDRTLMTLYEGRVVEWVSEAAEKRRSRIMMDSMEVSSNPRTPESSIFTDRSFRLSR